MHNELISNDSNIILHENVVVILSISSAPTEYILYFGLQHHFDPSCAIATMEQYNFAKFLPTICVILLQTGPPRDFGGPGTKLGHEAHCERSEQKIFSIKPFRLL